MWNDAFNIGGPGCTIEQFEQLTDVRSTTSSSSTSPAFKSMVDAIGGVEVCIPHAVNDPIGHITLPAGTHKFSGDQALNYVRERHTLGNGSDIGRMKRQQAFIASMAHQAISADTLANPIHLAKFIDAATKSLTLDPDLGSICQAGRAGLPVPPHRPGQDPVRDDALGARPQRPQPRGLGAHGAAGWDGRSATTSVLPKSLLSGSINAHHIPGVTKQAREASRATARQGSRPPRTSPTASAPETREGSLMADDRTRPRPRRTTSRRRIVAGVWRRSSATYCPRRRRTSATPSRRPRRTTRRPLAARQVPPHHG